MRWGLRYPQEFGNATVVIDVLDDFDAHDDLLSVPHCDGNAMMICQHELIHLNLFQHS